MGRSTKEVWQADAAGALLLYEPENLTLVKDPAHPLYDERVHLPLDEALVRSIMAKGIMQPICAVRDTATGHVLVAAGRQRTKAAIEANRRLAAEGRPTIRVPVIPRSDTLAGAMVVSAAENAIRRDETPLQRAGKMRRMRESGHDLDGIAEAFGCSTSTVENTLLPAALAKRKQEDAEREAAAQRQRLENCAREHAMQLLTLVGALDEALRAATAYVELDTCNGVREQPPSWAVDADGAFDPERIAWHCRSALRQSCELVAEVK